MPNNEERCSKLSMSIKNSINPVCFDTLVVGSGPVAMLIADLRYGGHSAFAYEDGQPCNAPLFFSMPGKPDQFKGHGSIVIGTGIQQSGLDVFTGNLDTVATEGIQRQGVSSKKATGESLSSALEQGREQLQMPIIGCWVDKVEQYTGHEKDWEATEEFGLRMLVKWPDGQQKYIYGRHIDLCLGAGPARHLDQKQMSEKEQSRALVDGSMCYLNETGFDAMAQNLRKKAAASDKPLRILLLNTHMSSSFVVQLIENPETIFGDQKIPEIEITWLDRQANFTHFGQSSYADDQYLYQHYIQPGIGENAGRSLKKTGNMSLRIFTTKDDFSCSYSQEGELTAKWLGSGTEEQFDCFCVSLGQAQHKLHAQLINEFGSFSPAFFYKGELLDYGELPSEVTESAAGYTQTAQPSLIATHSQKGDVYTWGVAANTCLLGLDDNTRNFCRSLNQRNQPFFAPNTHAPGSLAVVLSQLHQVYSMAMLEREAFGEISKLRHTDPLWHLVKYKQQCRQRVLYYATVDELSTVITKSALKVLGYDDSTEEGAKIYAAYYPKCFSIATELLEKRGEIINRDEFSVALIEDRLRNELFLNEPNLSTDPIKEFYVHFNRNYCYKTITEALLDFSVLKIDPLSAAAHITSDEHKKMRRTLEKYVGAYRFGMNSTLDMNLLSMGAQRKHIISDHLPIAIRTTDTSHPPVKLISWNLLADVHLPNNFMALQADYLNGQNLDIEDFGYYAKRNHPEICDTYGLFFDLATFITSHDFYKEESNYLNLIRPKCAEDEQIATADFERILNDWIDEKLESEADQWHEPMSHEALRACRQKLISQLKNKGHLDAFKISCVTACKLKNHIESMQWQQRLNRLSENKSLTDQLKQQDFLTLQECTHPEEFLNKLCGENWSEEYGLLKTKAARQKGGAYLDAEPGDFCVIIYKKSKWKLDESTTPRFFALGNNDKPAILAKFISVAPLEPAALIVGSIHHPGGKENQIAAVLSELPDKTTPFIINGDFNHSKEDLNVPDGIALTASSNALGTMSGNDWGGVNMARDIDLSMHPKDLGLAVNTVIPIDRTAEQGVVTFQLYSKETEDGYNATAALSEIANIKKIYKRLAEEAARCNRKPPIFELVTMLVPNWDKEGNDFNHPEYVEKKKKYISELEKSLDIPVKVVDFTAPSIAEPYELAYMKDLKNFGIIADTIKNNAIIRHCDKPHIQLDTNTDILDFEKFYHATIGQNASNYRDALDVTMYNRFFLTVTNKVVFFAPEGAVSCRDRAFIKHLKDARDEFFRQSPEDLLASKSRNAAYEEIFTVALKRAGYVKTVTPKHRPDAIVQFHANVTDEGVLPFFGITPHIAVVARQTWQNKMGTASKGSGTERLKSLPPLQFGDTNLTSTHIAFIIRRYTGHVYLSLTADHEAFLKIIDVNLDRVILEKYFMKIKNEHPVYYLDILRVIPNIESGRNLLATMGEVYLLDSSKLVNIDNLLDEIKYGIEDADTQINQDRFKRVLGELSKELSEIYTSQETANLSVIALLNEWSSMSTASGAKDKDRIENILKSFKAIDNSAVDSRFYEITNTIIRRLEVSLEMFLDPSFDPKKFGLTNASSAEKTSPSGNEPMSLSGASDLVAASQNLPEAGNLEENKEEPRKDTSHASTESKKTLSPGTFGIFGVNQCAKVPPVEEKTASKIDPAKKF